MGPTASGKTDLALRLARFFPVEIISVDSAQVYQGMDIGTAKPNQELRATVPHHLIDIRDPADTYSAAEFRADANAVMADIVARGRIPLLAGGTSLYFRVLQQGLSDLPSADSVLRQKLIEESARLGWPELHRRLATVDPVAAERIHPNDHQRVQRALEVYELTSKSLSALWQSQQRQGSDFDFLKLAIGQIPRTELHERIAQRFRQMLQEGLVDEVSALRNRGDLHKDLASMRAVGYRQVWDYLDGQIDHEGMSKKGIEATRQLAKRQYTALRSEADLLWVEQISGSLEKTMEAWLMAG